MDAGGLCESPIVVVVSRASRALDAKSACFCLRAELCYDVGALFWQRGRGITAVTVNYFRMTVTPESDGILCLFFSPRSRHSLTLYHCSSPD